MSKIHELKILPKYFDDVQNHIKNFEVRFNDRDFKVGDILVLKEWWHGKYTGRKYETSIIYILDDTDYLNENYVILGLCVPSNNVMQYGNNNTCINNVGTLTIN